MQMANQLLALVMFLVGAVGCSDDLPVRATYTPADCPPAMKPDVALEAEPDVADEGGGGAPAEAEEEPPPPAEPGAPININTATEAELTVLPGVGPALAQRIVEYRSKRPFKKVTDLQRVRGIGPAKFEKMKAQVVVK